jgi:hypothetical protein
MKAKRQRFWRITMLYRGKETLIADVPTTHITEERLLTLMKMVFAKYTLTDREIVGCHLRTKVKGHRNLLRVQPFQSQDPISFMVCDGSNWVHAIVVRPEDLDPELRAEEERESKLCEERRRRDILGRIHEIMQDRPS